MKVIVTGAHGMVGGAVVKHCCEMGDETIGLSRRELNIADSDDVVAKITSENPTAVINCAAYTNVDGAESESGACNETNVNGVEILAAACSIVGSVFVSISTDYVFDGSYSGFYTQRNRPKPQGVYAKSKREGEIRAFAEYPRSIIVRSGWIFGRGGTNFLSQIPELLKNNKSITAIGDSYGTPTFADDLAVRLRELAAADLPGVYHVTNSGEGTSFLDFAMKTCEIGGLDSGLIRATSHADLNRPAPRPVSSKLACLISEPLGFSPLRRWENALESYYRS